MECLIVGIGAVGGVIATRLAAAGVPMSLATRDEQSAAALRASGLHVTGVGGDARAPVERADALAKYARTGTFDLIVLATKAREAVALAPQLVSLLRKKGTLLPLQNGGVPEQLATRLGDDRILGGFSNLGAAMIAPGRFEQRNGGHLVIGEFGGDPHQRADAIAQWLRSGVEVRVSTNIRGAIWSKLIVNCSVTTIGAIAGCTMREYIGLPAARDLFLRTYSETYAVARASGVDPEPLTFDPRPPHEDAAAWIERIVTAYGNIKPSMLQDFERGRETEIDYVNGYVVDLAQSLGVAATLNAQLVAKVRGITAGALQPSLATLLR